jgi:hypothetical protein
MINEELSLFETKVYLKQINLDCDKLYREVKLHQQKTETHKFSNSGGYQGHNFVNDDLKDSIARILPQNRNKPIQSFSMQSWVNVNSQGNWNDIHNHNDAGVLIIGVMYVKVPKQCGNLRLYDPRFFLSTNLYNTYYNTGQGNYISIQPFENLVVMFPPWLHHSVEPNSTSEERVSIAFNIVDVVF